MREEVIDLGKMRTRKIVNKVEKTQRAKKRKRKTKLEGKSEQTSHKY